MAIARLQEELEAIREENGGILRAPDVVAWAREHPDSELHSRFTWDDAKAGDAYRLQEARAVIRVCVFVRPESKETIRTYVSLEPDRQESGGGYRHLSEVISNQERRQILLKQALREFERLRQKYRALRELASLFASIDELSALEVSTPAINEDRLDLLVDEAKRPD